MNKVFFKTARLHLILLTFLANSIYAYSPAAGENLNEIYNSENNSASHYQADTTETPDKSIEEQVLDEIELISEELDKMEQSGQLSPPVKFAIAGALGTIAYGVAHTQIAWLFQPDFYSLSGVAVVEGPSWINALLRGVFDTEYLSLMTGALIGLANYFPQDLPSLTIDELVVPGLITIISTLAMTTLGAYFLPSSPDYAMSMLNTAFYVTMPISTLTLMTAIYYKRTDLHDKNQLDLKHRLQEARKAFEQKK